MKGPTHWSQWLARAIVMWRDRRRSNDRILERTEVMLRGGSRSIDRLRDAG